MSTGTTVRPLLRYAPSEADVHLVCLPHAGAGASSFARWPGLFPARFSLVRAQLPGREDAAGEPPLRRVGDAVDVLLPAVRDLPEGRIALYGHSMGALVAFELARALSAAVTPPVHLFVSGRRAPHLGARRAPIQHLPEQDFAAAGRVLRATSDSPAFLRYALPLIRADLELSEEYSWDRIRLDCPVMAFLGTEDPVVDPDEIEAWTSLTGASFAAHRFPGGHFFHQDNRAAIAALIARALG